MTGVQTCALPIFAFGTDTFKIATAETPTNVEPPAPVELNYTALEEKIMASGKYFQRGFNVTNLLGYTVDENGDLLVLVEIENKYSSKLAGLYKLEGDFSVESQEDIDVLTNEIGKTDFARVSTFVKAQEDITIDGETYSRDGIEGDNLFAKQCGIENAELTFFGDLGKDTYSDTATGYGRALNVMVVSKDLEGNLVITKKIFMIESRSNYTLDQVYSNFQNEDKRHLHSEESYEIGSLIGGSVSEKTNVEDKDFKM